MKRVIQSLFCLFVLATSVLHAQHSSDKDGMSIDKQLVFVLNSTNINEIQSTYTVDISSLQFKSSEALDQFCNSFSWEFHTLAGNFNTKEISVRLNKSVIIQKKYDVDKLNEYFRSVSPRMQYIYQQLNK